MFLAVIPAVIPASVSIIRDLAKIFNQLNENDPLKAEILTNIGGEYQTEKLAALFLAVIPAVIPASARGITSKVSINFVAEFNKESRNDPLKAEILTNIGGEYQTEKLAALLQNMDLFDKMLVDYSNWLFQHL